MPTPINIRGLNQSSASSGSGYTQNRGFRIPALPKASLTTALAGANNDMVFTARSGGTGGNSIRVAIVVAGASTPLSVGVSGNDITINSATSAGSAATTTASQAIAAVNASAAASNLVKATLASGNDGSGVIAAQALTNLTGGSATETNMSVATDSDITVDVDNPQVRVALRNNAGKWIEHLQGGDQLVVRGLRSSEAAAGPSQSRGFRARPAAGGTDVRVNQGGAQTLDLSHGGTRRVLRQMWKDHVPAASGSNLITIRGLDRSEAYTQTGAQTSGLVSRGLTIRNQAGTPSRLSPMANIQVNLDDAYVRRILRRNRDKFVVVSAP